MKTFRNQIEMIEDTHLQVGEEVSVEYWAFVDDDGNIEHEEYSPMVYVISECSPDVDGGEFIDISNYIMHEIKENK